MFRDLRSLAKSEMPVKTMVEWGAEGRANAVKFCCEMGHFYGVDISQATLAECQRQLESRRFAGFRPVLIDVERPEECLEIVGEPVHFFLSTAVYQHFPSKEYGRQITALAFELLADKGIALIQIRYDDGFEGFKPKQRNYHRHAITFTSYGIAEFWDIVCQTGFTPLAVSLKQDVRYAYFYLRKDVRCPD